MGRQLDNRIAQYVRAPAMQFRYGAGRRDAAATRFWGCFPFVEVGKHGRGKRGGGEWVVIGRETGLGTHPSRVASDLWWWYTVVQHGVVQRVEARGRACAYVRAGQSRCGDLEDWDLVGHMAWDGA